MTTRRKSKPKPAPTEVEVEFTPSPALSALQGALDAEDAAEREQDAATFARLVSDEEVKATADAPFSGVDFGKAEPFVATDVVRVEKGDTGIYTDHNGIGHLATVDEVLTSTGGEIRVNLSVPTLNPPRMSGVIVVADCEPDTWYNPPYAEMVYHTEDSV